MTIHRTLNRYLLLEQLGSTGLGTVYRAQDPIQGREVCIKVIRPYICADKNLLDRFSLEMVHVGHLDHQNILTVYGKENDGDIHCIVMQHVSWPTLRQWLQQPIPVGQAMVILTQVAEAIEVGLSEGISHGDIKPGNIFLDPETGAILLSDFGMAMLADGAPVGIRTALNTPLPTYTAPEIGRGSSPTASSDIYSLGVLAYEMLTGVVPFSALERASVQVMQYTSAPTPPSQVNPNIPQQLDAVILKALSPHPERRYETPVQFIRALSDMAPMHQPSNIPFQIWKELEPNPAVSRLEPLEELPEKVDGPAIICTVCGHTNVAGTEWCAECWGVLERVAAAAGEEVILTGERTRRWKRTTRIQRGVLGLVTLTIVAAVAVQFLNIIPPLQATASTVSSDSGPGEWAMLHRTFGGPAPIPEENPTVNGVVKWKFDTSEPIESTPIVKGGKIYLTTMDKRVVALDAASGALIWEYNTVAPIDSSPAIAGDMIYIGARNQRLIALDAESGSQVWDFVTEGNPTLGSPIVKDGVVYFGSGDHNVYAIDALTGEERWHFPTRDWITNTPTLSDNILVVSSLDGRVTMYDTDTGKRRFSFRGFRGVSHAVGSPIIVGDSIHVPYRDGVLLSMNLMETEVLFASRLYRLKTQLWIWNMLSNPGFPKGIESLTRLPGDILTTPAADEHTIYVSTQQGTVYAVDSSTREIKWTSNLGAKGLSTPTIVGEILLIGDAKGQLHSIDTSNGEEQWSLQIARGAINTPVLADGILYLASGDGTLYAVQ